MKVALLTSDRERCGIARYSRDLYAALQTFVDVDLVPIDPWPPEGERLEQLRTADVVHLQHEYSFWGTAFPPPRVYYEGLERFRRAGRLVITAHTVADAETVVAARGGGLKPLVKRLALRLRPGMRTHIEAKPFHLADRVIVHSPAAIVLGKRLGRPERVQFWPMPVPEWASPASDWESLCQRLGLGGRRLITVFGFVSPAKDYETALASVRLVSVHLAKVLLVVAGTARTPEDRVYLKRLQASAREQFMAPLVRFTNYLSDADARAILEHSEVALLPYRSATGSYAAGTALAAGCPLVTSDLPAFAEPLPALRFSPGDVQDCATKLDLILRDAKLRSALAARSREYAVENGWPRAAEQHASLYRELKFLS